MTKRGKAPGTADNRTPHTVKPFTSGVKPNAVRPYVAEQADARRAQVYTDSAPHADKEASAPVPPRGPERDALVEQIRQMKAERMTHLEVGNALNMEASTIGRLCKAYGIVSLPKLKKAAE